MYLAYFPGQNYVLENIFKQVLNILYIRMYVLMDSSKFSGNQSRQTHQDDG